MGTGLTGLGAELLGVALRAGTLLARSGAGVSRDLPAFAAVRARCVSRAFSSGMSAPSGSLTGRAACGGVGSLGFAARAGRAGAAGVVGTGTGAGASAL